MPKWNGRDPVVHRAGDPPFALYHLAGKPPHIRKQPIDLCSYFGGSSGVWIPQGRDQVLGTHPLLGMTFGQWINRFNWEVNLEFQLGGTSNSYDVIYNGVTTSTSRYNGTYAGLNFGYSIIEVKKSVVYLTGGVGATGFRPIAQDKDNDGLSFDTFTKNCGVGIHHFGNKGHLLGATLLYTFLDYQNPGGTPLDGNAVTLRLTYAGFE